MAVVRPTNLRKLAWKRTREIDEKIAGSKTSCDEQPHKQQHSGLPCWGPREPRVPQQEVRVCVPRVASVRGVESVEARAERRASRREGNRRVRVGRGEGTSGAGGGQPVSRYILLCWWGKERVVMGGTGMG